jgi:hypothetical protein
MVRSDQKSCFSFQVLRLTFTADKFNILFTIFCRVLTYIEEEIDAIV